MKLPHPLDTNKGNRGEEIERRRYLKKLYDKIAHHEKTFKIPNCLYSIVSQKFTTKYFFVELHVLYLYGLYVEKDTIAFYDIVFSLLS